jgi:hypothetical protein
VGQFQNICLFPRIEYSPAPAVAGPLLRPNSLDRDAP